MSLSSLAIVSAVATTTVLDKLNVLSGFVGRRAEAAASTESGNLKRDEGGTGGEGGGSGSGGGGTGRPDGGRSGEDNCADRTANDPANPDWTCLALPTDLEKMLKPVLNDFEIELEPFTKPHEILKGCRMHRAVNGKWNAYLLHIDRRYLEEATFAPNVLQASTRFGAGDRVQVISRNSVGPIPAIERQWRDMERGGLFIGYVEWRHIKNLIDEHDVPDKAADHLRRALSLPDAVQRKGAQSPARGQVAVRQGGGTGAVEEKTPRLTPMPNGKTPHAIKGDAFKRSTDLLAKLADNSGLDSRLYFRDLMISAGLDDKLRLAGMAGFANNPGFNARHLVKWAETVGVHREHPQWALCGLLFNTLLESGELGVDSISLLASIIESHQLCIDDEAIANFRRTYGVPQWTVDGAVAADIGPDFVWMGPTNTVELQSFLRPRPLEFDFAFLEGAVRRGRSVCRIEFEKRKRFGSGVFLGRGFVLTNHHVVFDAVGTEAEAEVLQSECTVRFFGLGGTGGKSEVTGGLIAGGIVKWSSELDYALLKLDKGLAATPGLEAPPVVNRKPAPKEGTNLLHHPGGEDLKVSLSDAGVVTTLDTGFVQYITRSAPGSSGGPCFDDDWTLTAIHSRERSRPFGRVGEGILLTAIHPEIKELLK